MGLPRADQRHAQIAGMWMIPGPGLVLQSTADRQTSLLARDQMLRAIEDLRRVGKHLGV